MQDRLPDSMYAAGFVIKGWEDIVPDTILPSQISKEATDVNLPPEQRFYIGVILGALEDLRHSYKNLSDETLTLKGLSPSYILRADTQDWFYGREGYSAVSFHMACDALGVDENWLLDIVEKISWMWSYNGGKYPKITHTVDKQKKLDGKRVVHTKQHHYRRRLKQVGYSGKPINHRVKVA